MEKLTHKEALQRLQDVESELRTFCESSKELEEELELQLQDVSKERDSLSIELQKSKGSVAALELENSDLQTEINRLMENNRKQKELNHQEMTLLRQKLVDTEVINDALEQSKRAFESKIEALEEECGITIEKNALLENQVFVQGNEILNHQLTISNQEATILELRGKLDRFSRGIAQYATPPLDKNELKKLQNVT